MATTTTKTTTTTTTTTTVLPDDILRLIVEQASLASSLTLAQVSRKVQAWSEPLLYSQVTLHNPSTSLAFLKTIHTCPMKPPRFFARAVKSLCLSYEDVYEERIVQIITACPGVTSLTFWVVPRLHNYLRGRRNAISSSTHNSGVTGTLSAALSALRPKKLSVHLAGLSSSLFGLSHSIDFFRHVTHLSVIDRWEAWTTWKGFDMLPSLTHVSFDVSVGIVRGDLDNITLDPPHHVHSNDDNGEWDGHGYYLDYDYAGGITPVDVLPVTPTTTGSQDQNAQTTRLQRSVSAAHSIGRALAQNVLSGKCAAATLRVCVVLIMFDSSPGVTAGGILEGVLSARGAGTGITSSSILDTYVQSTPTTESKTTIHTGTELHARHVVHPSVHCSSSSNTSACLSDPRLVFIHDTEPFLDREAHSSREARVWEMAEGVVCARLAGATRSLEGRSGG